MKMFVYNQNTQQLARIYLYLMRIFAFNSYVRQKQRSIPGTATRTINLNAKIYVHAHTHYSIKSIFRLNSIFKNIQMHIKLACWWYAINHTFIFLLGVAHVSKCVYTLSLVYPINFPIYNGQKSAARWLFVLRRHIYTFYKAHTNIHFIIINIIATPALTRTHRDTLNINNQNGKSIYKLIYIERKRIETLFTIYFKTKKKKKRKC